MTRKWWGEGSCGLRQDDGGRQKLGDEFSTRAVDLAELRQTEAAAIVVVFEKAEFLHDQARLAVVMISKAHGIYSIEATNDGRRTQRLAVLVGLQADALHDIADLEPLPHHTAPA